MSVALTQFERRWAHAAFETIFPGPDRGVLPLGIADMDLDGFIDQTLEQVPFEAALGLRLVFWVIGLAPLFVLGRFATIASLAPADRMRVVSTINASPVYALGRRHDAQGARRALLLRRPTGAPAHGRASRPPVVTLRPPAGRSSRPPSSGAEHEPHRRTA